MRLTFSALHAGLALITAGTAGVVFDLMMRALRRGGILSGILAAIGTWATFLMAVSTWKVLHMAPYRVTLRKNGAKKLVHALLDCKGKEPLGLRHI